MMHEIDMPPPVPSVDRGRGLASRSHRPFGLVLAGGGARGLAHAGVLRALDHFGFTPSVIVGVSMGAIVATTYSLNGAWYRDLLAFDARELPQHRSHVGSGLTARVRALMDSTRLARSVLFGWGIGQADPSAAWRALDLLTRGLPLERGRVPVITVATDLRGGGRVALRSGNAARAAYASSALAGVQPPLEHEGALLADGGYSDLVPIDLARQTGVELVIAVDPGNPVFDSEPRNGLQAALRAAEICHVQHAHLRFEQADLVLRPEFPLRIDTLDFAHSRPVVAAGIRAVRSARTDLAHLLRSTGRIASGNGWLRTRP